MNQISTIEVHETIAANAKEASQEMRNVQSMKVTEAIRQGDIYMIRVNPTGTTRIPPKSVLEGR